MDYDFKHWPKLPTVSCTCITYGRPQLIGEAVQSYIDQDYPGESELIILNDQPDIKYNGGFLLKQNQSIKITNAPKRYATIGEKRNICVRLGDGEITMNFDDDDIHLPWRISLTVSKMTNHHYWKGDRLWVWGNGKLKQNTPNKAMAPSMAGCSREIFEKVGGYDHIQSGQDQTLDNKIHKLGLRMVGELTTDETYYMYKFAGTGSYHLSTHGYGKGYTQAANHIKKQKGGEFIINPGYKQDYLALIQPFRNK